MFSRLLILLLCLWLYPHFLSAQDTSYDNTDIYTIKGTNGLSLDIRRIGCQRTHPEARAILLVHGGGPGGVAAFDFGTGSFANSLAHKGFIVYLMNIRGWEGSTAPVYDIHDTSLTAGSCVEVADDIDSVIEHIRRREKVGRISLFGWAAGGHWVSYYTTLHNDKVDHLIVLNSLYGVSSPWSLSRDFADPADSNRYNTRIPIYRESDRKAIVASRLNSIPFPDKTPWVDTADLESYAWSVTNDSNHLSLRVPGGYRRESFNMAHGYQYWNARDIRVPTLIVRSQYDFWSRPVDVLRFYDDLTNAQRREAIELPNATHFVTIDKPIQGRDSLIAAIGRFIQPPAPWPLTIDSLRTDEQALTFARRFDGIFADLFIDPPRRPFSGPKNDLAWRGKYGAQAWQKGDFDGNGKTDLLFNGYIYISNLGAFAVRISFVVLDLGQDSFRIVQLTLGSFIDFFTAKKITIGNQDYIGTFQLTRTYSDRRSIDSLPKRFDTLMYAFDHFIERTKHPKPHFIHELHLCIWGGLTIDPGYSLIIRRDSIWLLEQNSFLSGAPMDSGGVFVARLDTVNTHKLYGLLQFINIPALRSGYSVSWTDDRTASLWIAYDNGKVKRIEDYGEIGTYGLATLYDLLDELRHVVHWTRLRPLTENYFPCGFK